MNDLQRFDAVLACALEVKGTLLSKKITADAALLSIEAAVKAEQQTKPAQGIYLDDLEKARQAIYFFVDELLLDPKLSLVSDLKWYNHSLQRKFFNTDRGGELFYVYFEQILDVLFNSMQMPDPSPPLKTTSIHRLSESIPSYSLNEKFNHVLQSIACLNIEAVESEFLSKLTVFAVYSQCLLFGFRGKYYAAEYDDMLKELRLGARSYFDMPQRNSMRMNVLEIQNIAHPSPELKKPFISYFFYVSCPLVFCIIWYLYCAKTVVEYTVDNI